MSLRETSLSRVSVDPVRVPEESLEAAEAAGLRYVNDRGLGFMRKPRGKKGFAYLDIDGKVLRDPKHLSRIRALVIPPAWTQVWISPYANGHIQATGRDARGRKQYLYHEEWRRVRDETKFTRMLHFGEKLPQLRRRIRADLKKPGVNREKVLAAIVSVMDRTLIRIGNDEYARENNSYGLTTFRNRHAKVRGDRVQFQFRGKSGIEHDIELEDPRVAKVIRKCQDLPGQDLFLFKNSDGAIGRIDSGDVNEYIKNLLSGDDFTAKDFRTWGGSVRALRCLLDLGPCEAMSEAKLKRQVSQALKQTALTLGNTLSVCRKYYVHPAVIESYSDGSAFKLSSQCAKMRGGLRPDERMFLRLLKSAQRAANKKRPLLRAGA